MSATAAAVFWDVVEESFDDAIFLWEMRDVALFTPERTPAEVEAGIEDRLRGALDGVTVGGAEVVARLLAPALASDQLPALAVAAHALLMGATAAGLGHFCAAFRTARGHALEALRRGLELAPAGELWVTLADELGDAGELVRAAFLEARAFRGLPFGAAEAELLSPAMHPAVQRAAARLLAHAPPAARAGWLVRALALTDPGAEQAAIQTGLIAGDRAAWVRCRERAAVSGPGRGQALLAVAMLGVEREQQPVSVALGDARWEREAIWALGFAGRRADADACVELLAQDRHPRLAAEAFCAITGLDLRESDLAVAPPLESLDETPEPDDVVDPVRSLPLADVAGVIRWWNRQRPRFRGGQRYLGGRPTTVGALVDALWHGPMRRRQALALELAVRTGGRVQLETGAFLAEQRRRLSAVDTERSE